PELSPFALPPKFRPSASIDLHSAIELGRIRKAASPVSNRFALQPRSQSIMSKVRVLVGTRKGAFILSSDGKRKEWEVSGPFFAGWEIYHMKGSPVDPDRIYASQTSGWFGQVIQRSDDGGKTWYQPGTPAGEGPATGPPK